MDPATLLESKPSRSDDLVDPQEQLRVAEAVRQKFAEEAPKRHRKPSRSDLLDTPAQEEEEVLSGEIPECVRLRALAQSSTERLVSKYPSDAPEEFVETEYYKDLNAVDKTLHHTTGTGFIQVENKGSANFDFSPDDGFTRTKGQCNPATNDWIPSADTVFTASDKPHRSEP